MNEDQVPLSSDSPLPEQLELQASITAQPNPQPYIQAEPTQQQLENAVLNFVIKVIPPPPKDILQKLNPEAPADKALALSLKMVKQRQEKQAQQRKLLAELRNSRITQPASPVLEDLPRIISHQHSILRSQYLRQQYYSRLPRVAQRMSNSVVLPKLSLSQRKSLNRQQGAQVEKYKLINLRYEAKKIAMDLLYQVIGRAVELYHRKAGFSKKNNKKISELLAESLVRRTRKGSLTLSRVIDIVINQVDQIAERASDDSDGQSSEGEEGSQSSEEEDASEANSSQPDKISGSSVSSNQQQESASASQVEKQS